MLKNIPFKKILRYTFFLTISFLMGMGIGSYAIIYYESVATKPWSWKDSPVVVNCMGEDIDNQRIYDAVNFWILQGEKLGPIIYKGSEELCENRQAKYFILLKAAAPGQLDLNVYAITSTRRRLNNIVSATIYFDADTQNLPFLAEHELGHALGYSHVKVDGHVMYPYYEGMGGRFWFPN